MTELISDKRNAVRAFIVKNNKVLLLKKIYEPVNNPGVTCYALPGGGQDTGESLTQSLRRECIEEINSDVIVGSLIHVADVIKTRDTEPQTRRHLIEFVFECQIANDYKPESGSHPDKHQVDVIWVDKDDARNLIMTQPYMLDLIDSCQNIRPVYLGMFYKV